MIERKEVIAALDAEVVLIAYDEPSLLGAKMLHDMTLPYRLLLDRAKETYALWGMGRTSIMRAMLSPSLNWRYLKLLAKGERFLGTAPDMLQLGGDFVVTPDGYLAFAHRMKKKGDRAQVQTLMRELQVVSTHPEPKSTQPTIARGEGPIVGL